VRNKVVAPVRFVALAVLSVLMLTPLFWALGASLRPPEIPFALGNVFFHSYVSLANYEKALSLAPFGRYYLNTILQVTAIIGFQVITSSLAAFAFARYRFAGDRFLFTIILLQMMIPTAALLVPNFSTIRFLKLYDTIPGIALPFFGSAFATFLLRQTFLSLPRDLADAASIDGCRWDQELRHVYLSTSRASLAAIILSSLSYHWNDFLWPLVITQSDAARPLTAGLVRFTQMGEIGAQWGLLSAATMIVTVPLFIAFVAFQKQFVRGYISSGIK
jgi:sn-glycerol 3-phosphate transport system permease protein